MHPPLHAEGRVSVRDSRRATDQPTAPAPQAVPLALFSGVHDIERWCRKHQPGPHCILMRHPMDIELSRMTVYPRTGMNGRRGWVMCASERYGVARNPGSEVALKVRDAGGSKVELAYRLRKVRCTQRTWPMPMGSVVIGWPKTKAAAGI